MKKIFAAVVSAAVLACSAIGGIGGYASGSAYADTHTHSFSQTWSKGEVNHWHASTCGDDIVKDVAPHTFNASGVCSVCGYEKDEHVHTYNTAVWVKDAVNHWHASTCGHNIVTDIAKHIFTNGVCECGYAQPSANHSHSFSTAWSGDSYNHWHASTCGHNIVTDMAAHTSDARGICTVCGKVDGNAKPIELPAAVKSAGGYNEALFAEWETSSIAGVNAYWQESGSSNWVQLDRNLISFNDGTARVDAVGLKAGTYNLKISSGVGSDMVVSNIPVTAYDRSGYAHFGYDEGVGAYNDDGTLKDGALVIYVSDENKNDISDYVYKNTANGLVKEDISSYFWQGHKGIGYLLNNRGYENNTARENYGIQALAFKYGAVAVRLLDNVNAEVSPSKADASKSLIEGLTAYNSTDNGGSVGDNGRMARITNAKNLTIEGIGENAGIYGWGVHFVSNDNLHKTNYQAGRGFEVRNITFANYPEDAVGMEGTQGTKVDANGSITSGASSADAQLISPVQRCWIHNNVFLPGFCGDPAESDKGEGDGSCDFKRGRYYTLSYNYFTDCHKTNLVGSAKSSVTYDVTMHHNWWNNCGARQPLARRANIHFYNNYVSGDMSATPQPSLSYVSSIRAATYMFMEANYYDGCKAVVENGGETSGSEVSAAKSWNNVYYACFNGDASTHVSSRTEKVENTCKFIAENIDYSSFDTNSKLFYYNDSTQQSDCLLDDAVTARVKVMMYAGVNGFGKSAEQTAMNKYTPSSAVQLAESGDTVISLPTSKNDTEVNGVLFRGLTGASSGTIKGKGQIITFTLPAGGAMLEVTTTTAGEAAPELVDSTGKVWASKFTGKLTIELPEGTYFIGSGQKDKESTISALSFASSAESSAIRVQAAIDAINAIPETVTAESEPLIKAAQTAYSGLLASEKANFSAELKAKLDAAVLAVNQIKADAVIALIDGIGTVTVDSYAKINAAETAYDALTEEQKELVTNHSVLIAAQNAFAGFAVTSFKNIVDALVDVSTLSVTDETAIANAKNAYLDAYDVYENFGDDRKAEIEQSYVDKLDNGLEALEQLEKLFVFREMLAGFTVDNVTVSEGAALKSAYTALNDAQKAVVTASEKSKYDEIIAAYEHVASQMVVSTFISAQPSNSTFKVNSGSAKNSSATIYAYDGDALPSGIKMESGTQIEFTIAVKMNLKLYFDAAGDVRIGTNKTTNKEGNSGEPNYSTKLEGKDNVVDVTLEAGTYYITKNSGFNLYYATLMPAS